MSGVTETSVYDLITDLCENALQKQGVKYLRFGNIRRVRAAAFSFLKKQLSESSNPNRTQLNPVDELLCHSFNKNITCAENDVIERRKARLLSEYVGIVINESFFSTDLGLSALRFLLCMKDFQLECDVLAEERLREIQYAEPKYFKFPNRDNYCMEEWPKYKDDEEIIDNYDFWKHQYSKLCLESYILIHDSSFIKQQLSNVPPRSDSSDSSESSFDSRDVVYEKQVHSINYENSHHFIKQQLSNVPPPSGSSDSSESSYDSRDVVCEKQVHSINYDNSHRIDTSKGAYPKYTKNIKSKTDLSNASNDSDTSSIGSSSVESFSYEQLSTIPLKQELFWQATDKKPTIPVEVFPLPQMNTFSCASSPLSCNVTFNSVTTSSTDSILRNSECESGQRHGWSWEYLGKQFIPYEQLFAGESNALFELSSFLDNESISDLHIISGEDFLRYLKLATVGISSVLFILTENSTLHMQKNIIIRNISQQTLKSIADDIEIYGSCYYRLIKMYSLSEQKEGIVLQTLCRALNVYLNFFGYNVFKNNNETVGQFITRIRESCKQLNNLAKVLGAHPNDNNNLPIGANILMYLYHAICRTRQDSVLWILIYLLNSCCYVYFIYLHKWMFHGILAKNSEIFITLLDMHTPHNKFFYEKNFFIHQHYIPEFIWGYQHDIFKCGKLSLFLKQYKPTHPLFSIELPKVTVCLNGKDVDRLNKIYKEYYEKIRTICGEPLTIRDIFAEEEKKKKQFALISTKCQHEHIQRWEAEQKMVLTLKNNIKRERAAEIQADIQRAADLKRQCELAELEEEMYYIRIQQENEDRILREENIKLRKNIEYFEELCKTIDERAERLHNTKINTLTNETKTNSTNAAINNENNNLECMDNMKKSASDILNSNDLVPDALTNRSQSVNSLLMDNVKSDSNSNNISVKTHMNCHTVNFNEQHNLTSCEQNRRAMMQSNIFPAINSYEKRQNLIIDLNTDRARNRKNVLDHEFNLSPLTVPTPMSTTSDFTIDDKVDDIKNANLLTLEINTPDINIPNLTPLKEDAPECALNLNKLNDSKIDHRKKSTSVILNSNDLMPDASINRSQSVNSLLMDNVNCDSHSNNISVKTHMNCHTVNGNKQNNLTSCEQNRRAMMQSNICAAINSYDKRQNLIIDLNTDRARNRKNVLDHEFNLSPLTVPNPMSTTSDFTIDDKVDDIKNANLLTLEISTPDINIPNLTPLKEDVPEYALNLNKLNDSKVDHCYFNTEDNAVIEDNVLFENVSYNKNSEDSQSFSNSGVNSHLTFSVINMTEYLQKSITIPLKTQYEILNNEVMRIFLKDEDILGHVRSLRNYLLLMDGKFATSICEDIMSRLNTGKTQIFNYHLLHFILNSGISSSMRPDDKNSKMLSFKIPDEIPKQTNYLSLAVLSHINLCYRVQWPIELIITPESLDQYSKIFGYLFKVRCITWVLERSYQLLNPTSCKYSRKLVYSPQYRKIQWIRYKIYQFIYALKTHTTNYALQGSWKAFKNDILNIQTISELYRAHSHYIKKVLFLCLLNNSSVEFNTSIENIFKIALKFYKNLKSHTFELRNGDEFYTHARYHQLLRNEMDFDKMVQYIIHIGSKIVRRGYQKELKNFIYLINFNNYYIKMP